MQTDTRALLGGGEADDELEDPEAGAVFEVDLDEVEREEADEAVGEEDEEVAELAIEEEELEESELDGDVEEAADEVKGNGAGAHATNRAVTAVTAEEDEEDEEDEDKEADLDVILRERMGGGPAAEAEEEIEEDEAPTLLATATEEYRPRGANEFVCRSCFLVKDLRQLADPVNGFCVDCANGN